MNEDSPYRGIMTLIGLTIFILVLAYLAAGCAEYPVTISVKGDEGKVSYSRHHGIEIEIEK